MGWSSCKLIAIISCKATFGNEQCRVFLCVIQCYATNLWPHNNSFNSTAAAFYNVLLKFNARQASSSRQHSHTKFVFKFHWFSSKFNVNENPEDSLQEMISGQLVWVKQGSLWVWKLSHMTIVNYHLHNASLQPHSHVLFTHYSINSDCSLGNETTMVICKQWSVKMAKSNWNRWTDILSLWLTPGTSPRSSSSSCGIIRESSWASMALMWGLFTNWELLQLKEVDSFIEPPNLKPKCLLSWKQWMDNGSH